jgi:hypothetical protein
MDPILAILAVVSAVGIARAVWSSIRPLRFGLWRYDRRSVSSCIQVLSGEPEKPDAEYGLQAHLDITLILMSI